jgi:hypothetical protein
MKLFIAALISAFILARVVPVQSRQASDQSDIPAEEYAIYSAAIGHKFTDAKALVILDRTVCHACITLDVEDEDERLKQESPSTSQKRSVSFLLYTEVDRLEEGFPSISRETIDDFERKNAKSHRLTNSLDLKLNYTLTTRENIKQLLENHFDWQNEFQKQFSDSSDFITLSRAGLNSTGDQALVYLHHGCGWGCSSGQYLLLVKKDKEWVVQKGSVGWIS